MIRFLDLQKINLHHQKEIEDAILKVFRSGWYVLGESVEKFEKNFADYCGIKHCIGVSNGLDALVLIFNNCLVIIFSISKYNLNYIS